MDSTDQAHGKTLVNQYVDILVLQNPIQISFRLTQTFTIQMSTEIPQPCLNIGGKTSQAWLSVMGEEGSLG